MLMVNALAGCGKTTTGLWGLGDRVKKGVIITQEQKAIIEEMRRYKGTAAACAFNVSIKNELQARAPKGITVATCNGFGNTAWCKHLNISKCTVDPYKNSKLFRDLVGKSMEWKERARVESAVSKLVSLAKCYVFNISAESACNWIEGDTWVDGRGAMLWLCDRFDIDNDPVVLDYAVKVFLKGVSTESYIDFDDQNFLPLFYQVKTIPKFDHLLVDEAADLNRAKQAMAFEMGRQITAIGDVHQCQPAGTMVTVCHSVGNRFNPAMYITRDIAELKPGSHVVAYSTEDECYIANAVVKEVAKRDYKGNMFSVTCNNKTTRCTFNHKFVVRWKEVPTDLWCTYIMRRGNQFRVGWCQVFMVNGDFHLGVRTRLEEADCSWIVQLHTSKAEASMHEQQLSIKYSIPTVMFKAVSNAEVYTQPVLDNFWEWADTNGNYANAVKLLEAHKLDVDTPFYTSGTKRKKGKTTMFEVAACNMAVVQNYLSLPSTDVISSARVKKWDSIQVSSSYYEGVVYSISVARHHTYIADGVCTHNSIYGFSGADSESFDNIWSRMVQLDGNAKSMGLTLTRRCPKLVVKLANTIVPELRAADDAPDGIEMKMGMQDFMPIMGDEPSMIICRVNAPLTSLAFRMISERKRCYIQGRDIGAGLKSELRGTGTNILSDALARAYDKIDKRIREVASRDFVDEAKIEALNDKKLCIEVLSAEADTIEEFNNVVDSLFKDSGGPDDTRLSSCHKAKGLEHKNVFIYDAGRLQLKAKKAYQKKQEANLAYVAYTRSMHKLVRVYSDKD